MQKTAYMLLSPLSFGYPKQKTATEWTSGDETQAGARRNPPKDKTTSSKSIINLEWGDLASVFQHVQPRLVLGVSTKGPSCSTTTAQSRRSEPLFFCIVEILASSKEIKTAEQSESHLEASFKSKHGPPL